MSNHLLLCSIVAVGAAACGDATADQIASPAASADRTPVKIAREIVAEAPTPDLLTLTGRLAADQRAEVTADVPGKVLEVLVRRGQRVARGEPVVRIDVRSAAAQSREASAHLAAALAEQRLADQECERSAALLAKGAITRSEADRTAARCSSAGSQVGAAAARAQLLAQSVSDGVVRAPFDGVVAERSVTAGEWVAPGRPLFTLVDADPFTIELSVPEVSIPAVHVGQAVELAVVSRPGTTYPAAITRIGAEIGRSRSLIVEATLAPAVDLVPGMFAEARIVVGHTRRPAIPASAAVQRGDQRDKEWHVFVVHEAELEERIVQLGPAPAIGRVSILQNLAAGEIVVRAPTPQLTDGVAWAE